MIYLVIGASGLVGSRFVELKKKDEVLTPFLDVLDITDEDSVEEYFKKNKDSFDTVINFAAYTDVDGAEKQRGDKSGIAWVLNVEGAKNVAEVAHKYDKFLIHISTDFVFPGTEEDPGPYTEDAKTQETPKGISWYGWTKLEGERRVNEACPEAAIVRISYPYYAARYELKTDFAKKMLDLYKEGNLYPLFEDQVMSTLYVDDLVEVVDKLAEKRTPGIYHAVSSDQSTYWDFGSYLIEKAIGKKDAPEKGSMEEFLKAEGRTPRPRLGGMRTEKTQEKLGLKFKTWRQGIDDFVRNLD